MAHPLRAGSGSVHMTRPPSPDQPVATRPIPARRGRFCFQRRRSKHTIALPGGRARFYVASI